MIVMVGDQASIQVMQRDIAAAKHLGLTVNEEFREIGRDVFRVWEILMDDGSVRRSFEMPVEVSIEIVKLEQTKTQLANQITEADAEISKLRAF